MHTKDAIALGGWLYEQRPLVKKYERTPDQMMDLLTSSMAMMLRRQLRLDHRRSDRALEEFYEAARYGPWEPK